MPERTDEERRLMREYQRQRRAARAAAGLCTACGARPVTVYAALCAACRALQRKSDRRRRGCGAWRPGGRGRPPKDRGAAP